ncbi:hypothetical protein ABZ372_14925 [Streptomyces sp. NPDC005921]
MTLMLEAADTSHISRRTASPTWLVVALACAGQFLVVLDVSVESCRQVLRRSPAAVARRASASTRPFQ